MISERIKNQISKSSMVRQMFEKAEQLKNELGADAVCDFSLGNPIVEPPQEFFEGIASILKEHKAGNHRYMINAGLLSTRELIAERLTAEHGIKFGPEHIIMTCGAGGALNVLFKALLNDTETVITFAPYFMEYDHYVQNGSGRLLVVQTDQSFNPEINALHDALGSGTRAVLINSPNNPTGVVYSQEMVNKIGNELKTAEARYKKDILLISDEPYTKLVYENAQNPSIFAAHDNAILVTSHSKDYGLAGERIGYIAISPKIKKSDELASALAYCNRILGFVNAPSLMQRILPHLYKSQVNIEHYAKMRELACQILDSAGFEYVKPQGAFYIFPKSPISDDVKFTEMAANYGIMVVPGSGFSRPGHFRMSYSVSEPTMIKSRDLFKQLFIDCQKLSNDYDLN